MRWPVTTAVAAALALVAGSAGPSGAAPAPAVPAEAGFTARVSNPYYPLLKGMRWEYHGAKDGRQLRNVVRVTGRVQRIDGVPCAVIDDRVWLDGRLAERTTDWYTQDVHGIVWYYGERTAELDLGGRVISREGSW